MTHWKETLLCELVGLARATDGNEHLITDSVTELLAEILCGTVGSEAEFFAYIKKIRAAKEEMVPDCFLCANPCGRTAALDLKALEGESQAVREAKYGILQELERLAASHRDSRSDRKLYRGLVLLGLEGYSPEELTALFSEF